MGRYHERISRMSPIVAVNTRQFDPIGDRPSMGGGPARTAYTHASRGVTYTVEPSDGGTYTMTSSADPAAVVVVDVDHAARLIDEIEGVGAV
jgi:hypothetical protein